MAAGGAAVVAGALSGTAGATTRSATGVRSSGLAPGLQKFIGFSQPDTTAAVWPELMIGAQTVANKLGYTLLRSHANSELSLQLAEIEDWIAEGAAGIIVLPLDDDAMAPLITEAHAKGIKILDYSDIALKHIDGYVIFDNLASAKSVGEFAGHWVNETLGGKAEVALFTRVISLTCRQRMTSINWLQKVAPGAKVVASHDGVFSPQTIGPMQSMLVAHPNINVVICNSDEGCDGVLQAFMETKPSAARQKEMFICGFDGSAPVLEAIIDGTPIRATGALNCFAIGEACVTATVAAIEGKSTGRWINFPYQTVTYETIPLAKQLLKLAEET
jgi:ribose transport system substrate-binding protein